MPQPGDLPKQQSRAEDSFLDLLVETLETVEKPARAQFLQRFFKTMAQLELDDEQALLYWDQILLRRQELSESLGKRISMRTAMVDVLASSDYLRVPILMEFGELKKLQNNASTDPLTGLYNRRLFEEYCEKELNRARRYGQHLALAILDLHEFKDVNDRYGHMQGDQILQTAATTLRKTLRASDFAFRYGGDEFALLLPQADPEQAATLCRRIRAAYEAAVKSLNLDIPISLDFGISVHPQDGEQKETLLKLADERLYHQKKSSRSHSRAAELERPPTPREAASQRTSPDAPEIPGPREPVIPREKIAPEEKAAPREIPVPRVTPPPREDFVPREVPIHHETPSPFGVPAKAREAEPASSPTFTPARQPGAREQRKWERVSLAGTRAYATLGEGAGNSAQVIDLSYGGVAIQVDNPDDLPNQFHAILHVPILPPVRVSLRKVYVLKTETQHSRIGCAFVS